MYIRYENNNDSIARKINTNESIYIKKSLIFKFQEKILNMELEKSKKKNINDTGNQDGPEFSELKKV